eukprot:4724046-Prymnesium_polylepis.1
MRVAPDQKSVYTALEARTYETFVSGLRAPSEERGLSHSVCPVAFIPQHQNGRFSPTMRTRLTHRRLCQCHMTTDQAILLLQASARGRAVRWRM